MVGGVSDFTSSYVDLLIEGAKIKDIKVLYMGSEEAEAVKLFSNTYLAMRIAYFNELDTYAELKNLNSREIILGLGLDPRIGPHYNNPSFGYGGYCLPKDTKQLKANFQDIPSDIIASVVKSNSTRKDFISNQIISKKPSIVGVYRLIMNSGSDNFRESAIQDIIDRLKNHTKVIIYEPILKTVDKAHLNGLILENNLSKFKMKSDIIVANRMSDELNDVRDKVYSRDIFNCD